VTETRACHICGDPADDANSVTCNNCNERYHLRLRNDSEGKDCGEVWINEEYLSLEFACFACLGAGQASDEPPIGGGH
jgi:hypothetical protein